MALNVRTIEGHLEKQGTGHVSRFLPKKRNWCFLIDTTLHCHQESTNKQSSVATSIDLKQAQSIKKVTTDRTGMQFEIATKDKTTVFTASSPEECNDWVKHLQTAMTRNDNNVKSNSSSDVEQVQSQSVSLPDDYAEICDPIVEMRHKSNTANENQTESSIYESVNIDDDVFNRASQTVDQDINKSDAHKSKSSTKSVEYTKVLQKNQRTQQNNNKQSETVQTNIFRNRDNSSDSDGESIDDIHALIPQSFPSIPKDQHTLNKKDLSPLSDLQNFLSNNNFKRGSYQHGDNEDPFKSLKSYMNSLNVQSN
ncbi:src kinase-associated phosphoprotein 2 [Patella vulgata]|uniref:src kinase-associated phosphoprotein 2 n=1 Tax=Patella vulgata TaxID=6465 RepID=UPI00217FF443|nr:src kinase-associated phosphoprotein 2 [Patella vulgata]